MNVLVTGASGFVGGNLVREIALREPGWNIAVLVRPPAGNSRDADVGCEQRVGDITAPESLTSACKGIDIVFHCAALFTLRTGQQELLRKVNVEGTRNVLAAARAAKVSKVIYTSTGATTGVPSNGGPADEDTPFNKADTANDYTLSKFHAEQIALAAARDGMDVVVLNPVAPVGPGDVKPTPTGQFVIRFFRRRLGYYFDSITHFVHIRDVVDGHIRAVARGRAGQKYLLGAGNHRMSELMGRVSAALQMPPPPWIRLPHGFCLPAGHAIDLVKALTGFKTSLGSATVRYAASIPPYDFRKAHEELGMIQTPIESAFRDARDWFQQNGYLA